MCRSLVMPTKTCVRCETSKLAEAFKPVARMRDGLDSWCRDCRKAYDQERSKRRRKSDRIGRPPKLVLEGERMVCGTCRLLKPLAMFAKDATTPSGRRSRCKSCDSTAAQIYYDRHREKRIAAAAAWNKANPERRQDIEKRKRRRDVSYRLACYLRSRISGALRRQLRGESVTGKRLASAVRDLGCTITELMRHLESKFQPGMSWQNMGEWHVDHIRPLASFDLTDILHCKAACHFTNLQPLWGPDNLAKGSKPPE
jgi:hypothetical protein